jgi:hypothetical protein
MPLSIPRRFAFDRPCDAPACTFGTMMLIEEAAWGGRLARIAPEILAGTCLNHVHVLLQTLQRLAAGPGYCIPCADEHSYCLHLRDGDWHGTLCRGHAMAYVSRTLAPAAFHRLVADAGGDPELVHALHADFYDAEHGIPHQPFPFATDTLAAFITGLATLPDWDPSDDASDPEIATMLELVSTEYCEKTGMALEDDVARQLVAAVLTNEQFRRGGDSP